MKKMHDGWLLLFCVGVLLVRKIILFKLYEHYLHYSYAELREILKYLKKMHSLDVKTSGEQILDYWSNIFCECVKPQ